MTVQQVVHEPQDFPGTMAGAAGALRSCAGDTGTAGAGAPDRSDFLRFASPIRMIRAFIIQVLPQRGGRPSAA
jgi:hypothetical protein